MFEMYPDPVKSVLIVRSELENANYDIYDTRGNEKLSGPINSTSETRINTTALPSGQYFIRVSSEGREQSGRFLKIDR